MNLAMCGDCLAVFCRSVHQGDCPICDSKQIIVGLTVQEVFEPRADASDALNEVVIQSSYNLLLHGAVM